MAENLPEQSPQEIEERKIHTLVEQYKERLGSFEVFAVGDAGFIVGSKRQLPMAGNDWFLFDYDDTFRATTEVKGKRLELFKDYANKLGIDVPDKDLAEVMEATDKFSRWEDTPAGRDSYHPNAHISALDWSIRKLQEFANQRQDNSVDTSEVTTNIKQTLNRIKHELSGEDTNQPDDPFHFSASDKKLILASKIPWSKDIEDIFMQTMVNPPDYPETLQAAKDIGQPKDSIHRVNVGIFTYGTPYYQLLKVFEMLEQNPDLPISQMWLTNVPKGQFLEELVKSNATQKTELQYIPYMLEEDSMESMSYGLGYPLGEHSHTIVMMDDSLKELNSMLAKSEYLKEHTGASFVGVRSRRSNTKEGGKEWEVRTPYGEVDFRSKNLTAREVSGILQINRYLSYRNQFGDQNPRTLALLPVLHELGINESDLQSAA